MNPNQKSEATSKSQTNRYTASGVPFQSKFMNKFTAVMEKVENGTQTIRQTGLQRLSVVIHQFADKLDELNKNLDLNTPTRERALESSKKREARAANSGKETVKDTVRKDPASEQSPKAPAESSAV